MDRHSTCQEHVKVLEKIIRKLKDNKYDLRIRVEILKSGLTRYDRKVADEIAGTSQIHRSATDLVESSRQKPLRAATWLYQKRRRGRQNHQALK